MSGRGGGFISLENLLYLARNFPVFFTFAVSYPIHFSNINTLCATCFITNLMFGLIKFSNKNLFGHFFWDSIIMMYNSKYLGLEDKRVQYTHTHTKRQ